MYSLKRIAPVTKNTMYLTMLGYNSTYNHVILSLFYVGGAEWLSMMQNQALAAGLGAGYLPGMMPGYMPPTELSKQHKALMAGSSKSKDEFKRIHESMT